MITNAIPGASLFTRQQFRSLSPTQQLAIETVGAYLSEVPPDWHSLTDEDWAEILNLLRPCRGCVPEEEVDAGILEAIRRKFTAIYQAGISLAKAELEPRNPPLTERLNCHLVIDPSWEDVTHVVVLAGPQPVCYLHEWVKAWQFHFSGLALWADEVLRIKEHLIHQIERQASHPPH